MNRQTFIGIAIGALLTLGLLAFAKMAAEHMVAVEQCAATRQEGAE